MHPQSLLGRLQAAGDTVESLPAAGILKSSLPPTDDDLDALIEQYLAQSEGRTAAAPLPTAATAVSTDELLDTARLFADELAASAARKAHVENKLFGAPPPSAEPPHKTFSDILADFVTPGDLLELPSLERVDTINPLTKEP